jgi:hypothetical protein
MIQQAPFSNAELRVYEKFFYSIEGPFGWKHRADVVEFYIREPMDRLGWNMEMGFIIRVQPDQNWTKGPVTMQRCVAISLVNTAEVIVDELTKNTRELSIEAFNVLMRYQMGDYLDEKIQSAVDYERRWLLNTNPALLIRSALATIGRRLGQQIRGLAPVKPENDDA